MQKLNNNEIKTRLMRYHGKEFVVWEEKDADEVEKLLDVIPEQLQHMREIRESLNNANKN